MPVAAAGRMAVLAALAIGFAAAGHADCTGTLTASADGNGLRVVLNVPCAPYRPVTLAVGPVQIPDETGAHGTLDLRLPAVTGATDIRATGQGIDLSAPVPSGAGGGFVWIVPEGASPGLLPVIGLPGTAARPEMQMYPAGATPGHLDLPVGRANCGRPLRFGLLRDGWRDLRQVTVQMPDCAFEGARLRLPLPSE